MDGFLSFIFYCIIGFYLLGFLGRLALRLWIRRIQKRYEQNPNGSNFKGYSWNFGAGQQQQQQEQKSEGEVTIKTPEQQKRVNKNIGEYVDFEEVKDSTDSH